MPIPPFLNLASPEEYERHFLGTYCSKPTITFDGFAIWFKHADFFHAFYESSPKIHKSEFSFERAVRMDWIKIALTNPDCELRMGYDKEKKAHVDDRRVTIVYKDYVIIIGINRKKMKGYFITAFVAGENTLNKIKSSPNWV